MRHLHDGEYMHIYKIILPLITNSNEKLLLIPPFTSLAHFHNLYVKDAFFLFFPLLD
jgi:hypothetical protein